MIPHDRRCCQERTKTFLLRQLYPDIILQGLLLFKRLEERPVQLFWSTQVQTRGFAAIGMLEYLNIGIMSFGLRLRFQPAGPTGRRVEPTARRGNWDIGQLEKFPIDI